MASFSVTFRELSVEYVKCNQNLNLLDPFLKAKMKLSSENFIEVKHQISKQFVHVFNKKWQQSSRKLSRFLSKNDTWLQGTYIYNINKSFILMIGIFLRCFGGSTENPFE